MLNPFKYWLVNWVWLDFQAPGLRLDQALPCWDFTCLIITCYVLKGLLVRRDQLVVAALEPRDRLLGAECAAAHGAIAVGVAGQTAVQPDHHKRKRLAFDAARCRCRHHIGKAQPRLPSQPAQVWNDTAGKEDLCIALVQHHGILP